MSTKLLFCFLMNACSVFLIFNAEQKKILLFTYACKHPELIVIQKKAFEKFFLFDYEWIIFNNADDPKNQAAINTCCSNLAIKCIVVPEIVRTQAAVESQRKKLCKLFPNDIVAFSNFNNDDIFFYRNLLAQAMQYSLDLLGYAFEGIVGFIEDDVFPIKKFNPFNFLAGHHVIYVTKPEIINLFDTQLIFVDMKNLPNKKLFGLNEAMIYTNNKWSRGDNGSQSIYYIKNTPQALAKGFDRTYYCSQNSPNALRELFANNFLFGDRKLQLFFDEHFLHLKSITWPFAWNNDCSKELHVPDKITLFLTFAQKFYT